MTNDRFNDAWILLSIGDAGGCDRLIPPDELAAMADSNNHAIPTPGELSGALESLGAAGLIAVLGEDVRLTEAGCAAYREANGFAGGHIARVFSLAEDWSRRFPPDAQSKASNAGASVSEGLMR